MNVKKIIKIVGINIAVLLVMLSAVEGVSRLIIPESETKSIFNDPELRTRGRAFVTPDEARGFALKPGFASGLYTINAEGFRGEAFPEDFSKRRKILTLGESTTFGWGVRDNETYPDYLAGRMGTGEGAPYVINGGVPSYTSSQVLAYLRQILREERIKPDTLLINILWNDIWYSTITNWHPDILIFQQPPRWMTYLVNHSRLVRGMVMGFDTDEALVNIENTAALAQYEKNLEEMIALCREAGIEVFLVAPPFDADHFPESGLNEFHVRYTKEFFIETAGKYHASLNAVAERGGVEVIGHRLGLQNLHQESLFLDALHPTPEGNAIMAEDIYNHLRSNSGAASAPKSEGA